MSKKKKKVNKKVDKNTEKVSKETTAKVDKKATKKAPKEVVQKELKIPDAVKGKDIDETTGTRYRAGSARQLAFETILKAVKAGKNASDIRAELSQMRKENGNKYNMDAGYLNFVIASHPEYFKYMSDGTITLIKEPVIKKSSAKVEKQEKVKEMKKSAKKVKKMRDKKKKKKKKKSSE